MPEYTQLSEEFLPEDYIPKWETLEIAKSEQPFMEASFNLLHQCGHLAIIITTLKPIAPLDRNRAIISGLVIRLTKLLKVILRDLSNHETFQQLGISRQFIETAATMKYLLADDGTGERFDKYVLDSLVAEREMLAAIKKNIQDRGGNSQHIEERMSKSIKITAKAAGIDDVSALSSRRSIGFPTPATRIASLGENAYIAYRSGSSEIHGSWTDLFKHHLEYDGAEFNPHLDEPQPRPQVPNAITSIMCRTMNDYLDTYGDKQVSEAFKHTMNDILERTTRLTRLHESYLERTMSAITLDTA